MIVIVVIISIIILAIGYLTYGRYITKKFNLDDSKVTPSCAINDASTMSCKGVTAAGAAFLRYRRSRANRRPHSCRHLVRMAPRNTMDYYRCDLHRRIHDSGLSSRRCGIMLLRLPSL